MINQRVFILQRDCFTMSHGIPHNWKVLCVLKTIQLMKKYIGNYFNTICFPKAKCTLYKVRGNRICRVTQDEGGLREN